MTLSPAPAGASGTGTPRAAPRPANSPASARSPSARAPAPRHPRKRPLHHPAAARDRESPCFPGPLHDLDEGSEAALRQRLPGLRPGVAAVRPQLRHLGRLPGIARTASGAPSRSCTSAPAAPGARPGTPRRPPSGAASCPLAFLPASQPDGPPVSVVFTDWPSIAAAAGSGERAAQRAQRVRHPFQGAVVAPRAGVVLHGRRGRKAPGNRAPLASRRKNPTPFDQNYRSCRPRCPRLSPSRSSRPFACCQRRCQIPESLT